MSNIKTKAIFYAYSNNALDHLAPYVILCHQKNMNCIVIYGEDYIIHKVKPKKNIIKIFEEQNIGTYNISNFGTTGFIQIIFSYLWIFTKIIEKNSFIPNFFKIKLKGTCKRIYEYLDGSLIGKNLALNLLKDTNKVLVFTDFWSRNKKIQNSFLLNMKGKATIITTGHDVFHFHHKPLGTQDKNFSEDIALTSNHWEESYRSHIKQREIFGNLRFSKNWLNILDKHSSEKFSEVSKKKNVLILTHNENYTSDWKRMFKLFHQLVKREDINLRILPHIRGMSNLEPPSEIEKAWDKTTTLDVSIKQSDVVIFWVSSGFFEAVVRNKKILYLSFLSTLDDKFLWKKNAPPNIIVNNETELDNELNNYNKDKNYYLDNSCFKELIWPNGDPWSNVSNFLDKLLKND
jgi:hypothetical protein